jgi:hypothetical protein
MVREQSFLGEDNENPYFHLHEFEHTCACLHIVGMSDETLRWKLFPFSLIGRAKHWYNQTIGSREGDWEALCSSFSLNFFPISRVGFYRLNKKKKNLLERYGNDLMILLMPALTLPFKTPFFFNTFIWVLIGKPHSFLT